jgi:hypothetical protein
MIDLHLINAALASLGISAGVAVLIAAAVITLAALGRHRAVARRGQPSPAELRAGARAAAPAEDASRSGQSRREPALR